MRVAFEFHYLPRDAINKIPGYIVGAIQDMISCIHRNELLDLHAVNITGKLDQYHESIINFLDVLNSEKKYFNITHQRLHSAELVIALLTQNVIVGIGGLEKKYNIIRSFIILKDGFQNKGLGKKLISEVLKEAIKRYNIIMAIIDENNIGSISMHLSVGYRIAGNRENLHYLFYPINIKGKIIFMSMRLLLPSISIFNRIVF